MAEKQLRFKVTEERTELLPLGVYRRLDKDPDAHLYFVAHYLVDDAGYLVQYDADGVYQAGIERAYQLLDPLPLKQIKRLMAAIQGDAEESAVPK